MIAFALLAPMLPSALATWSAFGTHEPDNAKDSPAFLFTNATALPGQIYFNHFDNLLFGTNPNVGATESRLATPGVSHPVAMLGEWLDCNGDSYVGIAESALEEYPSSLLTPSGLARCPDGTAHNAGGWVTELRWIGSNHPFSGVYPAQLDPRMIVDNASMVWGDLGLPDEAKAPTSGTCSLSPGEGTLHSTGGLLNFADCNTNFLAYGAYDALLLGGTVGAFGVNETLPGADPSNALHLAEPNCQAQAGCAHWQNAHALNRQTFGADRNEGGQPILVAQDCSGGGSFPRALPPGFVVLNLGGSLAASVTELREEAADDCRADAKEPGFYECYLPASVAACESDAGHSDKGIDKTTPNYVFNFSGPLVAPLGGRGWEAALLGFNVNPVSSGAPFCLGLSRAGCQELQGADLWASSTSRIGTRPGLVTGDPTRATLRVEGPRYATYYAHVSRGLGATPGGGAKYGDAQCPTIGAGASPANGWSCDPSAWYRTSDGGAPAELSWYAHPKVGQDYELRDVDCDDGQISPRVGAAAGTEFIAATNCDTP